MAGADYTDVHRLFLQNILCESVLLKHDASEMLRNLSRLKNGNDDADLVSVINAINSRIKNFGMEIRFAACEVTLKSYMVLINTKQDGISKSMKYYTGSDQAFLRKIFDEIFNSNEGYANSNFCINLNDQISKTFSKSDATATLKKLVNDKWLLLKGGKVYIGVRSRLELEPYFKEVYGEYLSACGLCNNLLLFGYSCKACEKSYHNLCIQKYFKTVKEDAHCPSCKILWTDVLISEDSLPEEINNLSERVSDLDLPSTSTGGSTQPTSSRKLLVRDFDILGESSNDISQKSSRKRMKRSSRETSHTNGHDNY